MLDKEVQRLYDALHDRLVDYENMIPGFSDFTGIGKPMGEQGTFGIYNTINTVSQIFVALSLSSHPAVIELAESKIDPYSFEAKEFAEKKPLQGMKIADLGCGQTPSFARCARYFGADAYTVDIFEASEFEHSASFPESMRRLEAEKHLNVDLNDDKAAERLTSLGTDFDLITATHLSMYFQVDVEGLAIPLLKPKGLIYLADSNIAIKK
jgi:2-polyprenyl-3-methyl-5-hydroxy-6-metoxy-1,4-benzoquinol methylase